MAHLPVFVIAPPHFRLTAPHRYGDQADPMPKDAAIAVLDTAQADNSRQWELVLLLGDPETVDTARRWRDAVRALEPLTLQGPWDRAQWDTAVHGVDHERDAFHAAARHGLGVTGEAVDQFGFLRDLHGDHPARH